MVLLILYAWFSLGGYLHAKLYMRIGRPREALAFSLFFMPGLILTSFTWFWETGCTLTAYGWAALKAKWEREMEASVEEEIRDLLGENYRPSAQRPCQVLADGAPVGAEKPRA